MSRMWQYAKQQYGDMGPDRLYSIHHQGRYSGGHPSYYFDASHDMRNVSDVGPGPWNPGAYDIASHEVAHVVESTAAGAQGSPSFPVWRDSKWAEIFQYDVYLALGLTADAQRVFTRFTNQSDSFPRAGTRWFRDWYYPLYRDRGGVKLLTRYFQLLAQHFPKNGKRYSRNLNFGEYVHFMCGAAQMDCKAMAEAAFGNAWDAQYQAARTAFPRSLTELRQQRPVDRRVHQLLAVFGQAAGGGLAREEAHPARGGGAHHHRGALGVAEDRGPAGHAGEAGHPLGGGGGHAPAQRRRHGQHGTLPVSRRPWDGPAMLMVICVPLSWP
jgi:hypothetical protein